MYAHIQYTDPGSPTHVHIHTFWLVARKVWLGAVGSGANVYNSPLVTTGSRPGTRDDHAQIVCKESRQYKVWIRVSNSLVMTGINSGMEGGHATVVCQDETIMCGS